MPVTPTFPGVYVEEIPSGVRTITAVSTSVAAFVDYFARGPMNKAVQIFSMGDFEREFGGLDPRSEASYAIQQFFLNGGTEAWVVRVAGGTGTNAPAKATTVIRDGIGGGASTASTVSAISEGAWANNLRVRIDHVDGNLFNLIVTEYESVDGTVRPARSETHRNLSASATNVNFVENVVNNASQLVRVKANAGAMPVQIGTVSDAIGSSVTFSTTTTLPAVSVSIGSETKTATLPEKPSGSVPLSRAASLLQSAIRGAKPEDPAFAGASVEVFGGTKLRVLAGAGKPESVVSFAAPSGTGADTKTVDDLKLQPKAAGGGNPAVNPVANVQEYTLGTTSAVTNTAQGGGTAGASGTAPDGATLIGDLASKTGIYALEDADFNILCIPRTSITGTNDLSSTEAQAVLSVAEAYCATRRAFLLVDTPVGVDDPTEIKAWVSDNSTLRNKNAALYYPRVRIPDPRNSFRLRSVGASGTIAGLYARTDTERGVWKAPAGTDAGLRNVAALEDVLTDGENGSLNQLGINCLRNFPVYGNVCWGARTLVGSDQQASEWKYVPIRRLALNIEESLFRGTKWVVFEPNDEPLWAQIRLNVGAFMHNLFRQGAFQGTSPREAYFVKCDNETTTQNDIDLGIVNIVVGFAPLKPAEFVILKIQQIAPEIET